MIAANGHPGASVRLIRHAANRGYGAALKSGLAQASGDLVAFLDADGTYPPEYFPRLCREVLAGADVAGTAVPAALRSPRTWCQL